MSKDLLQMSGSRFMFSAEAFAISDGFQTSSIRHHEVGEILCRVHTESNADVHVTYTPLGMRSLTFMSIYSPECCLFSSKKQSY